MSELTERPFFIVGQPRSGTTLLRAIVNSHPRLYVPPETGFLPFLRIDGRSPTGNRRLALADMRTLLEQIGRLNREWYGLVSEAPALYQELTGGREQPTVTKTLDALYRRIMGDQGARWGDKTPTYVCYIPLINRLCPHAQFIHVIRDGRDATLSALEKWQDRPHLDSYYLLRRWVENVNAGRRDGRRLGPDRYLEIHYEALVTQPEETVRALCDFLGESFHPAMLNHTRQFEASGAVGGHPEVRNPIFTSSAGRWRREMTPFDRKLAHHLAGPTLRAFGYETPDPGPWTAGERLRLLLLSVRYRLLSAVRRALYAAGVLTLNRGKRQKARPAARRSA